MKKLTLVFAALLLVALTAFAAEPVDYVNTLVGTMSNYSLSAGNTYPSVSMPWGTHSWTPQTGKMGSGWAYVYTENKIRGIKMTHQPSPWINDYGQFSIMPVTTGEFYREDERASWFSHKAETAKPYYYSVYLAEHDTFIEMTPTEHAASFRITYPEREQSYLVIDAFDRGSHIETSADGRKISGYSTRNSTGIEGDFKLWFVIESDTAFDSARVIDEEGHSYAILGQKTSRGQKIQLNVAASFIDAEQASVNLGELGDGDFDRICRKGRDRWNEILSRIEVKDSDTDHLRTFYSCLYRSVLFPRDLSEVNADGKRVHFSPYDGKVHNGYLFTDTGFWDTFRSLFALVDLVYPDMAAKMQEGLVNTYLESGFLPEWASPGHRQCMVGNNSASVVAEAYLKGIRGYDIGTLWEAVKHGAHNVHPTISSTGRLGYEFYDNLGYVPCDKGIKESAARTLEYAYDDWCIWQLGKALGKADSEISAYEKSSQNFRNLYRSDACLMSGRNADGSFPESFNPFKWGGDFTEGNALQYTWSVFHDPAGLADLMGGDSRMEAMLDTMFSLPPIYDDSYYGRVIHEILEMQVMNMGNYAHGNQPVQHCIYLYDWVGKPGKTQARVREVMEKFYSCTPDGYCGDEDNGQTSSWYVFSAMGFYPVCPASCQYAIGSPLFDEVTVHLPSGKDITITASGNGRDAVYVGKVTLNGRNYTRNYFTHNDLTEGAKIKFTMSREDVTNRGTAPQDKPYSYSNE